MLDKDVFKDKINMYMHNYNLTETMGKDKIRSWWKSTKHLNDEAFVRAMEYLMEKNIRPFGFMAVVRLSKEWDRDNKYLRMADELRKIPVDTAIKKKVAKFRGFIEELNSQFKIGKVTGLEAIDKAREMSHKLRLQYQIPVDHPGDNAKQHQYDAHKLFREWVLDAWEKRLN